MLLTKYKLYYKIEGDEYLNCYDTFDILMYHAAKAYAFNDINYVEDIVIEADGRPIEYCGWEPGMRMTFINAITGEVVWQRSFPEWDH
jgi:hypothetical protein